MRRYNENGKEIVVYSSGELAEPPRLPGADREMTDEESIAAALSDPDPLPPSEDTAPFVGKVRREALADLFPPETVEALLAPRRGRPNRNARRYSSPPDLTPILWSISATAATAGR